MHRRSFIKMMGITGAGCAVSDLPDIRKEVAQYYTSV